MFVTKWLQKKDASATKAILTYIRFSIISITEVTIVTSNINLVTGKANSSNSSSKEKMQGKTCDKTIAKIREVFFKALLIHCVFITGLEEHL